MYIQSKNNLIAGKHQKPIVTDFFFDKTKKKQRLVIFCHGYKGFKDWGAWDLVAQKFAESGIFFIKFNFSHNGGTPEQPIDFPDLDAFGHNNYIKELDDLETILDYISDPNFEYESWIDVSNITLIGHSRGGGIVTIKAAEDKRITKVISWAGVSDYKSRFPKGDALTNWKTNGTFYIKNGRTHQEMPHYYQFYTSFIAQEERLTISRATASIQIPHLIIHGTEDTTVTVQEANNLKKWNPNAELYLIKNADHVFNVRHPWDSDQIPKALFLAMEQSIRFTYI